MTANELIEEFKQNLANKYPQYGHSLRNALRIVRAKKQIKGKHSSVWCDKGEEMLAFGIPEIRDTYNKKHPTDVYITIYSRKVNGWCLCPISKLEVLEIIQ